jgi:hypothetical protein
MKSIYHFAHRISLKLIFCLILLTVMIGTQLVAASGPGHASRAETRTTASASPTRAELEKRFEQVKAEMARFGPTDDRIERYRSLIAQLKTVSDRVVQQDSQAPATPNAITASMCFTSQNLELARPTFLRPRTQATGSGIAPVSPNPCGPTTGNILAHYDIFQFNLTGCGTFPTQVTVTACPAGAGGCATGGANTDLIIYIYRSTGDLATNGATISPFNPSNPCTNVVAAVDDLTGNAVLANGASCDQLNTSDCLAACTGTTNLPGLKRTLGSGYFEVVISGSAAGSNGAYNLFVNAPGANCVLALNPTEAKLNSFTATGDDTGASLEWKTGVEVDNLGFNIYREADGVRTQLNKQMIAGAALTTGPGVNLKTGRSYRFSDDQPGAKANAQYWLEDMGLNGESTWHGPFAIDRSKPRDPAPHPAMGRISTLSNLGSDDDQAGATLPLARTAKPPETSAAQLRAQADLATQPAVKLAVNREGWYRVTQPELVAAGLDPNTHPRMLRLFADGKEQPFIVNGEAKGRFDASSSIEFYGMGLDSAVTDTRTYWVVAGSQPGLRIGQVPGKGSKTAAASFPYTVERKDHTLYFPALRNGDQESFFGAAIARNPVDQALALSHIDRSASAEATLEVALQGVTLQSHRVRVDMNGSVVGEVNFDGQAAGSTKLALKASMLKEGQNTVRLTPLGGDQDVSLVNYVRVTYGHTYTADNDALRFTLAKKQQVTIDGFSSSAIRVIDISDPDGVQEVAARVQRQGSGYGVTVAASGSGKSTLLAFADGQIKRPVDVTFNRPSNLRTPAAGADFVIVSHRDFIDSLKPLVALRESEGLSVIVVDVEDVYDEFNYGVKSPQAIKDFLAFATTSWKKAPRFAMLVGDASHDPKNYQGLGNSDFVPTKMIDTQLMKTSSDAWFADFNNDGAEDFALGRLSVRTADEAARMVARIINYNQSRPADGVLLISDVDDGYNFQNSAAQLRALVPANLKVQEVDRETMDDATARTTIIDALNRGQKIVNYSGHGNVNQWRGNILTNDDAEQLSNEQNLSLFITMTCLNGYFQDPAMDSLAESLMQARRGGAIAVWSSSGMTQPHDQARINQQLYRLLFSPGLGATRLGEAIAKAKSLETNRDVRMTWVLLGDPTLRLR